MDEAVTIAVVAKKLLGFLASDEKGKKFILNTIGIILVIIMLPLIALYGLFGAFSDSESFENQVIASIPTEEQAELQLVDNTLLEIKTVFNQRGMTEKDTMLAQEIYMEYLIGQESVSFVSEFADIFQTNIENNSLYVSIESKYGIAMTEKYENYFTEKYGRLHESQVNELPEIMI